MAFLYGLFIRLMYAGIALAGIFNRKARKLNRGTRGVVSRIENELRDNTPSKVKTIWVHCASLGEFEQGRPVIEALRESLPGGRIIITFFSPSGYEVRKNYPGADHVFYLPADTRRNVRRFVAAVKPDMAIFVKYEFWYNYLTELKLRGIPSYIISAIFRPESYFFTSKGKLARRMLYMINWFFVQDRVSADLLGSIGISENVTVCGDTRFDRVEMIAKSAPDTENIKRFAQGRMVMVCGSTWGPDEKLLVRLMHAHPGIKFIVAPHQIDHDRIDQMMEESGRGALRYSDISGSTDLSAATLLVIDCIGILSGVYRYGQIAYIGGGFGSGIHNILEAAVWGEPVIFGPRYSKFKEAVDLVDAGGAFSIDDYEELDEIFSSLASDPQKLQASSSIAADYVRDNIGATDVIVNHLLKE